MDIAAARLQFGRHYLLSLSDATDLIRIKELLSPYRSEQGLPLTMRYSRQGVGCEMRFSDTWRIAPAESLTLSLARSLGANCAFVEY